MFYNEANLKNIQSAEQVVFNVSYYFSHDLVFSRSRVLPCAWHRGLSSE